MKRVGVLARHHDGRVFAEPGGSADHPLLGVEQDGTVLEELGAVLASVAAPVAALAVEAGPVEGGEHVPGVGGGHDDSTS